MSFASFSADLDSVTSFLLFSAGGYEPVPETIQLSESGDGPVCSTVTVLAFITLIV